MGVEEVGLRHLPLAMQEIPWRLPTLVQLHSGIIHILRPILQQKSLAEQKILSFCISKLPPVKRQQMRSQFLAIAQAPTHQGLVAIQNTAILGSLLLADRGSCEKSPVFCKPLLVP